MKCLATPTSARLAVLGLVALLVFGNCARNVYRVLGPGTTPTQVAQLQQLNKKAYADYDAARQRPPGASGPTPAQVYDSAEAARRRLLSPAQYQRWQYPSVKPIRYPRRPPRGYR